MSGRSTTGSISLGTTFVAGRNRVPSPATGKMAFLIFCRLIDHPSAVCSAVIAQQLRTRSDRVKRGTRSEEHTSELQSLMRISYAVFCLKKKKKKHKHIERYTTL